MRFASIFAGLLGLVMFLSGCVTTNGYTAKTLDRGKVVLTPGVNNLLTVEQGSNDDVNTQAGLIPALGVAGGITDNIEIGARWHAPSTVEANLRFQLTPKSFEAFTLSTNAHAGMIFNISGIGDGDERQGYSKLGATLGKVMNGYEPFISYYRYTTPLELVSADVFDREVRWSVLTLGIGIPWKNDLMVPELNYLLTGDGMDGVLTIGFGIRASIR